MVFIIREFGLGLLYGLLVRSIRTNSRPCGFVTVTLLVDEAYYEGILNFIRVSHFFQWHM